MPFTLQYPVAQPRISQQFLENRYFNYFPLHPGHEGIDFLVPIGTPVMACADGEVAIVDPGGQTPYEIAYGVHIWLRHPQADGTVYRTLYAHLSRMNVRVGQRVKAGDVIGYSGNTGRSTGAHLHLSLKKDNQPPNQETRFRVTRPGLMKVKDTNQTWAVGEVVTYKYDYIDPTPYLTPATTVYLEKLTPDNITPTPISWRPDHPLRGMNGAGSADFMLQNGLRGWAVEPVYMVDQASQPLHFERHEASGMRVLVQWCYSRSQPEGGNGTFPVRSQYKAFTTWCIDRINQSKGVWGHIIGNEPNRRDQSPGGVAITPQDVATLYNDIWYPLPKGVRLSPPALDPTYTEGQDPLEYFRMMMRSLRGLEFLALHAFAPDSANPLDTTRLVKPAWQYRGFRMWEPFAGLVYSSYPNFHRIPIVITETNPYRYGTRTAWLPGDLLWLTTILGYTNNWNHMDGDQFVHGVVVGQSGVFRAIPALIQGLKDAGDLI